MEPDLISWEDSFLFQREPTIAQPATMNNSGASSSSNSNNNGGNKSKQKQPKSNKTIVVTNPPSTNTNSITNGKKKKKRKTNGDESMHHQPQPQLPQQPPPPPQPSANTGQQINNNSAAIRIKVKKAKVAPSNNKQESSVAPKSNIELDQARRPRLVPPATSYYNIIKRLLADVYVKQSTYCLYHLWLDCLYDEDVSYETILDSLRPILGQLSRADVPPRYIYLVASQPSDDVPPKPAGSCFIMISNSLIKKRAKSLDRFELKIMHNRMHMFKVSVPMLREHLKDSCSLVFTEAFLDLINVPAKLLRTIMDMHDEVTNGPQSVKPMVVQPQPSQAKPKPQAQQKKPMSPPPQKQQAAPKPKIIPTGDTPPLAKKTPTTVRRNRIAALLNGGILDEANRLGPESPDEVINIMCSSDDSSNDLVIDENPPNKFESPNKNNQLDEKLLNSLRSLGNVVIRVDNLPAKLTVRALNLMMGTFSLSSDQIVASKRKRNGHELMNIRIVMHSNSIIDMQKILTKNACQTYYDSILRIELTNFDELRQFLINNHDNIQRLDKDDKLPINAIGYSVDRDCDWQHKSFKMSFEQNV